MSTLDRPESRVRDPRRCRNLYLGQSGLRACLSEYLAKLFGLGKVPAELAGLPRHSLILCQRNSAKKLAVR
jgi:hypothetical protein